jgi:hypothetical protein
VKSDAVAIINILTGHSNHQRQKIKRHYRILYAKVSTQNNSISRRPTPCIHIGNYFDFGPRRDYLETTGDSTVHNVAKSCGKRKRERERQSGMIASDTKLGGGGLNKNFGFEGSQAVPARSSGRVNAYEQNYFKRNFMV